MNRKIFLLLAVLILVLTGCEQDTTPEEIDTNLYTTYTDGLEMDFTYEGLDFIANGVGEVTLSRCTDGDTAQFTNGSTTFAVRFLGIDTPESTYRIDPWGKAASAYTCDKLTNAETIVLEAEEERTDGNGRYLAWVWYDGRLLNLELIEEAYSNAKGATGTKYEDIIYDAELGTQDKDRRIWGEDDPDYDYSLEGQQISIEELATNPEEYEGTKVVVQGVVAAEVGVHPYLVDENGYGIYIYLGFSNSYSIEPGNEIRIEGLSLTFYEDQETGSPQLVGFLKSNIELISEGNVVTPREISVVDITTDDIGSLLSFQNLEVTEIYHSTDSGNYSITTEDSAGNVMRLYLDGLFEQSEIDAMFTVGGMVDVTAPLSRYRGQYQLVMSNLNLVEKK